MNGKKGLEDQPFELGLTLARIVLSTDLYAKQQSEVPRLTLSFVTAGLLVNDKGAHGLTDVMDRS